MCPHFMTQTVKIVTVHAETHRCGTRAKTKSQVSLNYKGYLVPFLRITVKEREREKKKKGRRMPQLKKKKKLRNLKVQNTHKYRSKYSPETTYMRISARLKGSSVFLNTVRLDNK